MFGKAQRWAAELSEIVKFVGDGHVERGIYQAMAASYAVLGDGQQGSSPGRRDTRCDAVQGVISHYLTAVRTEAGKNSGAPVEVTCHR